jgi:putative addiction module component (TIGR02574 family)
MTTTGQTILQAALDLPEKDRIALVEQLLVSISPDTNDTDEEELTALLEERLADVQQGRTPTVSWADLKKQK